MYFDLVKMSVAREIALGSRQFLRPSENLEEHRRGQLAGVGVLQRGMIRRKHEVPWRHLELGSMREPQLSPAADYTGAKEMRDVSVEGDFSQAYDHPQLNERGDLLIEIRRAISDLLR